MHKGKKALERIKAFRRPHIDLPTPMELSDIILYVAELEEALSGKTMHDAHNVALEKAAAEVIKYRNRFPQYPGFPASDIAAAIRALKT